MKTIKSADFNGYIPGSTSRRAYRHIVLAARYRRRELLTIDILAVAGAIAFVAWLVRG